MGHSHKNMAAEEEDYSVDAGGDAGATKPMEAGQVRKGGFIMIKGKPCKVVDVSTSKTGKHGHAKCHFVATNIFTNKKQEELCPATHNIDVPFVNRDDYQVMDIGDDADGAYLSLMDKDGNMREDLQMPHMTDGADEGDKKISQMLKDYMESGENEVYATVLRACKQEKIVDAKKQQA